LRTPFFGLRIKLAMARRSIAEGNIQNRRQMTQLSKKEQRLLLP
jgi:hypothetical protein